MPGQLIQFDNIIGQSGAIDALTAAHRVNRLPHALIFAGPVGVGKGTLALALAGLFLCEHPAGMKACGKCASCVGFNAGNHPDYHLVYRQLARLESEKVKARDLSVQVIRDFLIAKAAHKSVVGVGKVFVIEEADRMNAAAQNTLLKTLEEPPGRTLIILLTDQPDSLLSTIRSRCRLIRFAPLTVEQMQQVLRQHQLSDKQSAEAAEFAEGSPGLALRWMQDGVIDGARELSMILRKTCAGESASVLREWLKAAADAYAEKQLQRDPLASKDQATREGITVYLSVAADQIRRRLMSSAHDADQLQRLCDAIDVIVRAEGYLDSNVNSALVFQQLTNALDGALHPQMS